MIGSRPLCPLCQYPILRCPCTHITTLKNQLNELNTSTLWNIPIVIIQDHKEALHPYNTVKLLKLIFPQIWILPRDFNAPISSDEFLNSLYKQQFPKDELMVWTLVFPKLYLNANDVRHKSLEKFPFSTDHKNIRQGLILIDGNWKKAKKLYFQSSFLKDLNHLEIQGSYPSHYAVRKSPKHKEDFLSTYEALSYTLKENHQEKIGDVLILGFQKIMNDWKNLSFEKSNE